MPDKMRSVTSVEKQGGLSAALILGAVLGLAGGFGAQYEGLLNPKKHREPPYAHPDIKTEDLLATAYRMQPFYDIRREGTDAMFALINEQPSALLKALELYRNAGHTIAPTGLAHDSVESIEAFIQWCVDHQEQKAASMARAILEKELATFGNRPLPALEPRVF